MAPGISGGDIDMSVFITPRLWISLVFHGKLVCWGRLSTKMLSCQDVNSQMMVLRLLYQYNGNLFICKGSYYIGTERWWMPQEPMKIWFMACKNYDKGFQISKAATRGTRQNLMTSSKETIFGATGSLCGEFTGHRWIPLTNASDG